MKLFNVGFWYTVYGSAPIFANNEAEAEEKLEKLLDEVGLDNLQYKCNDRDFGAQDPEELDCLHSFNDGICSVCGVTATAKGKNTMALIEAKFGTKDDENNCR